MGLFFTTYVKKGDVLILHIFWAKVRNIWPIKSNSYMKVYSYYVGLNQVIYIYPISRNTRALKAVHSKKVQP